MIKAIREVDQLTPIIIEPSFWGHLDALDKLEIHSASDVDPMLVVSFHFYEPRLLVRRNENQGRFQFPGEVPIYEAKYSEKIMWDDEKIKSKISKAVEWATERNIKIFLGEFGISRDTIGADKYLQSVTNACKQFGISATLYSYRDQDWDAMNYELGSDTSIGRRVVPLSENNLMKTIHSFIKNFHER